MARDGRPVRARGLLGKFAGSMELPREVMLDVPRVIMIGTLQVHVENHKGILEYTPSRVRVRTPDGVVTVSGRRLRIGRIGREELTVDGRVDRVEIEDGPAPRREKPSP